MERLIPIRVEEQQCIEGKDKEYIDEMNLSFPKPERDEIPLFLGLDESGWSSYYVGAVWLKPDRRPLVVYPKVPNIDFISIFVDALEDEVSPSYFEKAYNIKLDSPFIEEQSLNTIISPLLVAHYISIIKLLLSKGLKRNYIIREENLNGKVRGHIMVRRNIQKNILRGHAEKTMCRYQEYSADYPENRLLKRGLLAAQSMMLSLKVTNNKLLHIIKSLLSSFNDISDEITPSAVKTIRRDKLRGEYPEAIRLAKLILQRTDFAITESSPSLNKVPEFAVDMSRIFEFYVLRVLRNYFRNEDVLFQEPAGIMGRADYIIPSAKLIVDAKYKENFPTRKDEYLLPDIREVSGYSRSERIRKKLSVEDDTEIQCLVIYPNGEYGDSSTAESSTSIFNLAKPLNGVHSFYTLGIPMPVLKTGKSTS